MRGRRGTNRAVILAISMASLSGCAMFHDKPEDPAWYSQRVHELRKGKYPKLAEVPKAAPSLKSPAEWKATETDVQSAGAALQASPRAAAAAPGAAATAGAFEAQARKEAGPAQPER
ncbi:MAG: hypothetical protein WDN76_10735 [Alphaproteobacteria bacterium]